MRGASAAPLSMEHNKLWVSAGYTHHLSNRGCEKNLFKGEPVRTHPCKISTSKFGREKTTSRASERKGGRCGPNQTKPIFGLSSLNGNLFSTDSKTRSPGFLRFGVFGSL